ncbi:hypothetical protein [Henriciella litoralis]|uniref:hypothetical protein n=1 Tax=Henriciella litoralis TaxID=568102 RepID=UPI00111C2241|nr:hypothetical protein [Henriciella litoralis]
MTFMKVCAAMLGATAVAFSAGAQSESTSDSPATSTTTTYSAPDAISSAAAIYANFHDHVTDLKQNDFSNADEIQEALSALGTQNSDQLARGWVAYSALVASQDPEFRAAVRDIEGFYGPDTVAQGLQNNVRFARSLNGGNSAVRAALSATEADSIRLKSTAEIVKEQAYSLQASSWAKGKMGNSGAVATRLRADSLVTRPPRSDLATTFSAPNIDNVLATAGKSGQSSFWDKLGGASRSVINLPTITSPFSRSSEKKLAYGKEPVADQIATLAAYRIIGNDGLHVTPAPTTMSDSETAACLNMAQLNLQQCIAATHQHFEVPFCIGEHALADVGRCISKVSQ